MTAGRAQSLSIRDVGIALPDRELMGDRKFIWACVATLPSFAAAALGRIDAEFGRKRD